MMIFQRSLFVLAIVFITLANAETVAGAGPVDPDTRYVTIFTEHVDGAPVPQSRVEDALVSALLARGLSLVDENQSRRIRSAATADDLVAGGAVPNVITTMDADRIIAGVVKAHRVNNDVLGPNLVRYDVRLSMRIISVDTGRILAAFEESAGGMGFAPDHAVEVAAKKAAEALSARIVASLQPAPVLRVELTVAEIPDVGQAEQILASIERVDGVEKVRPVKVGAGTSKVMVHVRGLDARELAVRLERDASVGIGVSGYTNATISAAYEAARALALELVVSRFASAGKRARRTWRGRVIAEVLGTSLAARDFLNPASPESVVDLPSAPAKWPAALAKRDIDARRAVVLAGTYRRIGSRMHVRARVHAASSGAVLSTSQQECVEETLGSCVTALGDRMASQLLEDIQKQRHQLRGWRPPPAAGGGAPPLRLANIDVEDVLPARLATGALGAVVVENRSKELIEALIINAHVPGFSRAPVDVTVGTLAAGARKRVALKLAFNPAALTAHNESGTAVVQLRARYRAGGQAFSDRRSRAFVIFGKNAMHWSDPESIAAIVTHERPAVRRVAMQAIAGVPEALEGQALANAAALFSALRALRYAPDPVNPFAASGIDFVQYPVQTLTQGGGDCDDLAVAYAALAESVSIPTLLVTTPGHVFVAVSTGLPMRNHAFVTPDSDRLVAYRDRAWLPLETTQLGGTFEEAWDRAVKTLRGARAAGKSPGVIEIRSAWKRFAPADFGGRSEAKPAVPAVGDAVRGAAAALERHRRFVVDARLESAAEGVPDALRARGQLLVADGRIDAARQAFRQAATGPRAHDALNDLANLLLMEGRSADAAAAHRKALAAAPKSAPIHLNAALGSWLRGDDQSFGEHIVNCIDAGGGAEVAALAEHAALFGAGPSTTASRDGGAAGMVELISKAYERAGRIVPANLAAAASATRASRGAARSPAAVIPFLFWL